MGVTYFVCDPLPSYFNECQKKEIYFLIEPAHEIMVLITQATSEGSGEPVHRRSLARAFAGRTHKVWKQMKGPTRSQTSSPIGWLRMHIWRISLRRTKSAIVSWDGSIDLWSLWPHKFKLHSDYKWEIQVLLVDGHFPFKIYFCPHLPDWLSQKWVKQSWRAIKLKLKKLFLHVKIPNIKQQPKTKNLHIRISRLIYVEWKRH